MTINIQHLNELSKKATQGVWNIGTRPPYVGEVGHQRVVRTHNTQIFDQPRMHYIADEWENAAFIVALVNAWSEIYKELKAGRELVEAVQETFANFGKLEKDERLRFYTVNLYESDVEAVDKALETYKTKIK